MNSTARLLISALVLGLASAPLTLCATADNGQQHSAAAGGNKQIYSPDRRHFVFVQSLKSTVSSGSGDSPADILWYGNSGSGTAEPLFKEGTAVDTHQQIGKVGVSNIHDLAFSPDGRRVYFLAACYATSDAVMAVDTQSRRIWYVTDGNSLKVIQKGPNKGNLLVERHKYHANGSGSFDTEEMVKP